MTIEVIAAPATQASGLQARDVIAICALSISLVLALREFVKRPRVIPWVHRMYQKTEDALVPVGLVLHVGNIGRAPAIVESAGERLNVSGTGSTALESVELLGKTYENPSLPMSLQPGEVATFRFAPGSVSMAGTFQIGIVRPRRLSVLWAGRRSVFRYNILAAASKEDVQEGAILLKDIVPVEPKRPWWWWFQALL